jgi:hypothetical protein
MRVTCGVRGCLKRKGVKLYAVDMRARGINVGRWGERVPLCMEHAYPKVPWRTVSMDTNNGTMGNSTNWSVSANTSAVWS